MKKSQNNVALKKELREKVIGLRKRFISSCPDVAAKESGHIWNEVENDEAFLKADTILLYCSLKDEVPSVDFIRKWYGRKTIALPVVYGANPLLREYSPENMVKGEKGVCEPSYDCPEINPSKVGYAVIPGVAFDMCGRRLGRGGGYYDRLLDMLECRKVGVAFKCQIMPEIPCEEYDRPVDKVISAL